MVSSWCRSCRKLVPVEREREGTDMFSSRLLWNISAQFLGTHPFVRPQEVAVPMVGRDMGVERGRTGHDRGRMDLLLGTYETCSTSRNPNSCRVKL